MSKPIKISEALIESVIKEFSANLQKTKMFDGKISYQKSFKWDCEEKAYVSFSIEAFTKMMMLVHQFDSEVAWHGVAYRDEEKPNQFYITDILVYPQVVTGATVETDQDKYQDWLYEQDDEVFNNIRMQGHSHVNFDTKPSGVDVTHQEKILAQLDDEMFYIFMIWNKKFKRTISIFDLKNNTLYENEDVEVNIESEGVDLKEFLKGANSQVVSKASKYGTGVTVYQGGKSSPAGSSGTGKNYSGQGYGGQGYGGQNYSGKGYGGQYGVKEKPQIGKGSEYDRFDGDDGWDRYCGYMR